MQFLIDPFVCKLYTAQIKQQQQTKPHKSCRCTRSGLKQITCPSGLAFDIEKQTCDWKAKVTNCDKKESKSVKLVQHLYHRHSEPL